MKLREADGVVNGKNNYKSYKGVYVCIAKQYTTLFRFVLFLTEWAGIVIS